MAFRVGARGPHVVDRPASGAFDGEADCLPFTQQPPTNSAPDLLHVQRLYRLRLRLLPPSHPWSPRGGSSRRKPVVRCASTGTVGRLSPPRLLHFFNRTPCRSSPPAPRQTPWPRPAASQSPRGSRHPWRWPWPTRAGAGGIGHPAGSGIDTRLYRTGRRTNSRAAAAPIPPAPTTWPTERDTGAHSPPCQGTPWPRRTNRRPWRPGPGRMRTDCWRTARRPPPPRPPLRDMT